MRSNEPKLAARRLCPDNEREAVSPSSPPEVYPRARVRLPSSLCKSSLRANFDWEDSWNDDYAKRPVLLDLFAGAGGAAFGYYLAGFRVVGVDINPQKNYPFRFVQADALHYPLDGFDVIHASPPCQAFTVAGNIHNGQPYQKKHPDLIDWARLRLQTNGKPYVIENVPGAPLDDPIMLCGTMFEGLMVYRHRLFECGGFDPGPAPGKCNHSHRMGKSKGEYHTLDKSPFITCVGHNFQAKSGRIAMGIPWMTRDELAQAIPPAYTEWIGKQLIKDLTRQPN